MVKPKYLTCTKVTASELFTYILAKRMDYFVSTMVNALTTPTTCHSVTFKYLGILHVVKHGEVAEE